MSVELIDQLLQRPRRKWKCEVSESTTELRHGLVVDPIELEAIRATLAALAQRVGELTIERDWHKSEVAEQYVNLRAAEERCKALEQDAVRWRWLADDAYLGSSTCEADMVALARKLANSHGKRSDRLLDEARAESNAMLTEVPNGSP